MAGLRHPRLARATLGLLLPLALLSPRRADAAPSPGTTAAPSAGRVGVEPDASADPPPDSTRRPSSDPAAPEPEPAPEPSPEPSPEPGSEARSVVPGVDPAEVAALQQEARALRDALFKARGRVSLVAAKLFTTRIALRLRSNLDRFYTVTNLTIRVDGAPVYVQGSGMPSTADDLFEVFAAPGSHALSVSADLVARRDATYKIRFEHSATVTVDADQMVSTRLLLRETGNMWRFAKTKRGRSDMRVRLSARAKSVARSKTAARARPAAAAKPATTGGAR